VVAGHLIGSAEAAAADHVLYGWLFFSIVTFLLILIGLPFRENSRTPVQRATTMPSGRLISRTLLSAAAVILVIAISRFVASSLDHLGRYGNISQVSIPTPVGCQSTPAPPSGLAENTDKSIGESNSRAYRCGDGVFVLTLHTYPARIGSRPVFASLRPA